MAFRQIKSPALANQAVLNTKLDVSSVAGHSAALTASVIRPVPAPGVAC